MLVFSMDFLPFDFTKWFHQLICHTETGRWQSTDLQWTVSIWRLFVRLLLRLQLRDSYWVSHWDSHWDFYWESQFETPLFSIRISSRARFSRYPSNCWFNDWISICALICFSVFKNDAHRLTKSRRILMDIQHSRFTLAFSIYKHFSICNSVCVFNLKTSKL